MNKLSILIADDHELLRRGIRTLLRRRRQWTTCGEVATAEAAVALTRRLKPDVVILDISFPNSKGLDLVPEVRRACRRTEIVVLTMHESARLICQLLADGVRVVVLKCDAADELVKAIEAASRRQVYLSQHVKDVLRNMGDQTPSLRVLTRREREVLRLLAEGRSGKEVAAELRISPKTVDTHRANLMGKLQVRSLNELIFFAIREGLIQVKS